MASSGDLDPGMWQDLPDDVLEEVLRRLPMEAIFRFRAVCKRWSEYPFSPSFRASSQHLTSRNPLLVAIQSLEDLRRAPVLPSYKKKWRGLGLSFLHRALLLADCNRIIGMGSDGGLLCVTALKKNRQSVIVVCNPVTQTWKLLPPNNNPWLPVVFRQVIVRVEQPSGDYRIFIFGSGSDLRYWGPGRANFVYSSSSDSFVPLPRLTNTLADMCGAFQGEIFYTLSRDCELIAFDTKSPNWTRTNTGIIMTDEAAGYKILVHDGRLFCAIALEGDPTVPEDVVEFRIYELNVATRQCFRLNTNLQCLFVNGPFGRSLNTRYAWDFVVHRDGLLLVARSGLVDRNTRWLEVFVGLQLEARSGEDDRNTRGLVSSQPFPSLAGAFSEELVSRTLLLSNLRLDFTQQV